MAALLGSSERGEGDRAGFASAVDGGGALRQAGFGADWEAFGGGLNGLDGCAIRNLSTSAKRFILPCSDFKCFSFFLCGLTVLLLQNVYNLLKLKKALQL